MFQTGSNKSLPFHDSLGFFVLISHQFSFELCSITPSVVKSHWLKVLIAVN